MVRVRLCVSISHDNLDGLPFRLVMSTALSGHCLIFEQRVLGGPHSLFTPDKNEFGLVRCVCVFQLEYSRVIRANRLLSTNQPLD